MEETMRAVQRGEGSAAGRSSLEVNVEVAVMIR